MKKNQTESINGLNDIVERIQLIPVEKARKNPEHTTVERVPLPGKGKK
jgi:hypothetical protein